MTAHVGHHVTGQWWTEPALEGNQAHARSVKALVAGIARGAARRKCAVAAARRLAVDLWRLATGQTTPEKLKLIVPAGVLT